MKNKNVLLVCCLFFLFASCADRPSEEQVAAADTVFKEVQQCFVSKGGLVASLAGQFKFDAAKAKQVCTGSEVTALKTSAECILAACNKLDMNSAASKSAFAESINNCSTGQPKLTKACDETFSLQ